MTLEHTIVELRPSEVAVLFTPISLLDTTDEADDASGTDDDDLILQ